MKKSRQVIHGKAEWSYPSGWTASFWVVALLTVGAAFAFPRGLRNVGSLSFEVKFILSVVFQSGSRDTKLYLQEVISPNRHQSSF